MTISKKLMSTTAFKLPFVPAVNDNPPVFIPKNPTIRLNGRKIAEIIVKIYIITFIFSFVRIV